MTRVWVLGAGGMLGGAISKELHRQGANIYKYSESFFWKSPDQLRLQFSLAVKEFLKVNSDGDNWEIYWAAGVGFMGSSKADLESETVALETLLSLLRQELGGSNTSGCIGFASSAGALYARCLDFEITEASPVTAVTNYAKNKLAQEQLLEEFASSVTGIKLFIARFSTLFGPGQSFGKQQGLLSHIARCALRHQPVEIFVPLDTSRDYLFVDDASRDFIESLRVLRNQDCVTRIKIIVAERSVTISEIVSTFNSLIKKRVSVIYNHNGMTDLYAPRVAYRTIFQHTTTGNEFNRHTLLEGVASLLSAERIAYISGSHKS